MKKLASIIGISLLLISGTVSIAITTSNKQIEQVNADYNPPRYTGLYERIEDPTEVTPGTQVILATLGGRVFDGVGGNPAYAHANRDGVTMFDAYNYNHTVCYEDKFIYLNNKAAVMLTVELGASEYLEEGHVIVSFKGNFNLNGTQYQHYFGENDEEQYDGNNDYSSIGWFLDCFGIRPNKDGKSTWELTYDDEENKMLMRKVYYNDLTSYLCYNYNGARHHFIFGNAESACTNLYRKVEDENLIRPIGDPSAYQDPTKMSYHKGESIEYDGLIVPFRIKRAEETYDDFLLDYNYMTNSFFSYPQTVGENPTIQVKVFGNSLQYVFNIIILSTGSNYRYNNTPSLPKDLRGTYLLSTENARILDASRSTESTMNYANLDDSIFTNGYITANTDALDQSIIKIVRTGIDGNYYYHAMNYLGQYLCIGNTQVNGQDEYYLDYTNEATISNAVTITNNSFKIGDYYLTDSEAHTKLICFSRVNYTMHYFKLDASTSSVASQVNGFISYFEDQTEVCGNADEDGITKIDDGLWNNIKTEFNKLSCDAQGIFASTEYVHEAASLATKENVVDRYDYILAKYDKEDFMLRKLCNTYVSNYSSKNPVSILINNQDNSTLIIIAVSVSILTTALVILFLKKKYN